MSATGQGVVSATVLRGVRTHNLKGIDCEIPHGQLVVVTGVSGSGKSSLAFDTLYAEGQRRYTESLSTNSRQFLQRLQRPPLDELRHVQPALALRQHNDIQTARSTVGTVTELEDHLQLIWAHAGQTVCPTCEAVVRRDTVASVVSELLAERVGARLIVVARVEVEQGVERGVLLRHLVSSGHRRLYVGGEVVDIDEGEIDGLLGLEVYPVVIDRVVVKEEERLRLSEALEAGFRLGRGRVDLYDRGDSTPKSYHESFTCNGCGRVFVEPQPLLFSVNSSLGACPVCTGFGKTIGVDFKKVVPNAGLSLERGAIAVFEGDRFATYKQGMLRACRAKSIPVDIAYNKLRKEDQRFVRDGGAGWLGVRKFFEQLERNPYAPANRVVLARYRGYDECAECDGTGLSEAARYVYVGGYRISDVRQRRLEEALELCESLRAGGLEGERLARVKVVLDEVLNRLRYLNEVGLGYLTLDRASRTLSGGELQRIHLTTSLGRALTETLYVLDEPTAGLHARDSGRLLKILYRLRDLGNTVVVVEHDPEIIEGADYVLELGPQGGDRGGELLFTGSMSEFMEAGSKGETLTSKMLGARRAPSEGPSVVLDPKKCIKIVGAKHHNLQDINVSLPIGRLTALAGVSGSGKSTLLHKVLYHTWRREQGQGGVEPVEVERVEGFELVEDVVMMGQSAIGRSARSNALSYTKAYDDIRKLFSQVNEAKQAGITAGDFSFNTPGGRCEHCQGVGTVTVELHFMADIEIVCPVCDGARFMPKVLEVRFRGKNILDVLEMTVDEGIEFFRESAPIVRKLSPLSEVGLGYLKLGQATTTLSGGEAQRLKLATYIAQGSRDKDDGGGRGVLFIFDEPTVGLHMSDVDVLLRALRRLVELGHTVVVIEHNLDLIARADHVIELGPGAGPSGGQVVIAGSPGEVARHAGSETGRYLSELLGIM
jgi:excinuclease ABC subunit A